MRKIVPLCEAVGAAEVRGKVVRLRRPVRRAVCIYPADPRNACGGRFRFVVQINGWFGAERAMKSYGAATAQEALGCARHLARHGLPILDLAGVLS